MIDLVPLGDRAFLARFASDESAALWAATVRDQSWEGVVDVVLAYQTVGVYADPRRVDLDSLELRLRRVEPGRSGRAEGIRVTIPVLYEGEDLPEVARSLRLSIADVVDAHSRHDYRVFALGFQPGFPYAGYLPAPLAGLPRRSPPRTRVPAGSVAIVGRQTAVYPAESPGGWHLIGKTPLIIADVQLGYFPIQAGDQIRFVPIDAEEYEQRRGERLQP
jgi:KipI family sensor histidine kinase inhibitor